MFVIKQSRATSDILSVLPCSLPDYNSRYKPLSDATTIYYFVDYSAFASSKDVGEFLLHPSNYKLLPGRDPSDNKLVSKKISNATKMTIAANTGTTKITVPTDTKYLAIKAMVAAGGRGSAVYKGGCGASIQNVVVDMTNATTLVIDIGRPGTASDPNGYPLSLTVDGNTIFKLGGGAGSLDNGSSVAPHPGELYTPDAGSGGLWEASIGGTALNGNSRSTIGAVNGYGGGGDYNRDGQTGYIDMYFTDLRPDIDGPLISNRRVATYTRCNEVYPGDPITQGVGSYTFHVAQDKPYLCLISASAAGGYGDNVIGGQGASQSVTWWALYPQQTVTISVGAGGTPDNKDGGSTTISYNFNGVDYPLLNLSGGKSTGEGGKVILSTGSNYFNGRDNASVPPSSVTGNYGYGGAVNSNGGDGIVTFAMCQWPPPGVKIYDGLEDPQYKS